MRNIEINGRDYIIEYSIEASLYKECTEKITNLMTGLAVADNKSDIKELISNIADIPQATLHMFHAGLLEHHELELVESKKLLAQYLKENKGSENGNFYSLMGVLIEEMGNDGFFEMIGLDKMFQTTPKKKTPKAPQDHKKKITPLKDTEK